MMKSLDILALIKIFGLIPGTFYLPENAFFIHNSSLLNSCCCLLLNGSYMLILRVVSERLQCQNFMGEEPIRRRRLFLEGYYSNLILCSYV